MDAAASLLRQCVALWPGSTLGQAEDAMRDATHTAEQTAARKLGAKPWQVAVASHGLWGRGLTDERDARVEERAPAGATPRSLQAWRGRVTRELLDELRPPLDRLRAEA